MKEQQQALSTAGRPRVVVPLMLYLMFSVAARKALCYQGLASHNLPRRSHLPAPKVASSCPEGRIFLPRRSRLPAPKVASPARAVEWGGSLRCQTDQLAVTLCIKGFGRFPAPT